MRRNIVGIGAVLVIFGVFLYYIGNNMVVNAPYNILGGGGFSGYESDINTGNALLSFGVILALIGSITAVAGFILSSEQDRIKKSVKNKDAIQVVKLRYANGEITKKEYIEKMETLGVIGAGVPDIEKFCTGCGKTVLDDAKICPHCGEKFDD